MDIFGLGKLWSTLIIVGALAGAVGGFIWHINDSAFNRGEVKGITETTEHMKIAIAKDKATAEANKGKWDATPPTAVDEEIKRRCVASCKDNAACIQGCE